MWETLNWSRSSTNRKKCHHYPKKGNMALSSLIFHLLKTNAPNPLKWWLHSLNKSFSCWNFKKVCYLLPRLEVMFHSLHLSSTSRKKITFPPKRWCGFALHLSSTSRKRIALIPLGFISLASIALHCRKLAKLASIWKTAKKSRSSAEILCGQQCGFYTWKHRPSMH